MNTQEQFENIIKSEMQKRIELFNNQVFRDKCALIAQEIGITEDEWNNNKFYFMTILKVDGSINTKTNMEHIGWRIGNMDIGLNTNTQIIKS